MVAENGIGGSRPPFRRVNAIEQQEDEEDADDADPQLKFTTSCEIKNGKANGFIHNRGDDFEIDGHMWFYFFDCDGNRIGENRENTFDWLPANSTEKVEDAKAPAEACSCEFDVSQAHIEQD